MGTQRLVSQGVLAARGGEPVDVVRRMGAMQAQDYGQSLWAIGSRVPGSTVQDVVAAIEGAQILRTWALRGTIHFVPASDARWMLDVSAGRSIAAHATRLAQLDLDDRVLRRCRELLQRELSGGRRLIRPRVMALFEDAGIATGQQRGYTILWHAAQSGLICLGPMEGKQQTLVLLDEWIPKPTPSPVDGAVTELARRYFQSHGPATAQDFAWWASVTVTDARRAVAAAQIGSHEINGAQYFSSAPTAARRRSIGARLLAGFDEFLLGYQDRSAVLTTGHAPLVVPGGNGVFKPTMVLDGVVTGAWKRVLKPKSMTIVLSPFTDRAGDIGNYQDEAERYAAFTGLSLGALSWDDRLVGS